MPKPPTLEEHEDRLRIHDRQIKELQAELQQVLNERRDFLSLQRRFFEEGKADFATMLGGAVTFVETAVGSLSKDLVPRFEVLETAAKNSEAERERRKLKDEGAAEQKLRDAAAKKIVDDEAALQKKEKADALEEEESKRDRTHKRRIAMWGVIVAILTILAGLGTAAIASHAH